MTLPANILRLTDAARENKKLTPRAMGELTDFFKTIEDSRLAADKVAASLKAEETLVKLAIAVALKKAETKVAGGSLFKVEMTQEEQPTVEDWQKFYAHILKTKDFDLLERRPGKAAVKARWEDGKTVPGVSKFTVDKLSFTKLKG